MAKALTSGGSSMRATGMPDWITAMVVSQAAPTLGNGQTPAAIASGRYHEGIEILSRYRDGVLSSWWPMHYYLGIAYACTGQAQEAVDAFKRALALSPSNLEVMDELISVYRALGDRENELKYTAKMEVVRKNHEAEERGE